MVFLKPSFSPFSSTPICCIQKCMKREAGGNQTGHCGVCIQRQPCQTGKEKEGVEAGSVKHCCPDSQFSSYETLPFSTVYYNTVIHLPPPTGQTTHRINAEVITLHLGRTVDLEDWNLPQSFLKADLTKTLKHRMPQEHLCFPSTQLRFQHLSLALWHYGIMIRINDQGDDIISLPENSVYLVFGVDFSSFATTWCAVLWAGRLALVPTPWRFSAMCAVSSGASIFHNYFQ